jgi:hypothetical protein
MNSEAVMGTVGGRAQVGTANPSLESPKTRFKIIANRTPP